jgi:type I restriction enzyme M protein
MLDTQTKKRIDDCRDILVGKLPDPKAQIEQITIGLIYKFMDDMDKEAIELGGSAKFFSGEYAKYSWDALFDTKVTATEMLKLYSEAIESMEKNPKIPQLFRDIFNNAYLPYRDPETLKLFLKTIGEFEYTHSEKLGDAFEYLLSVMGSQGDAGQFRTPRHIIDFLVAIVDPKKTDTILDPACGTAGFLISAFKHIKTQNHNKLTPDEQKRLIQNFVGYDISPDMVRLSLVNLYLHGFADPHIWEYDTLSSEERWNESFDVVLANPPFMSPKGGIRPHKKFTIKSNRSEVLFVDYIAEHLNPKGRAGIIVPEGVIFQSGTAYKDLRKMLVDNYLYAVVSLPAGVFNPYSGVKTSILLMDKEFAKTSNEILFVKIDNDGFNLGAQRTAVKGGQLTDAIELLNQFKNGEVAESKIAHAVLKTEIGKNGEFNLNGGRYKLSNIDSTDYELVKLGDVCQFIDYRGKTPTKTESGIPLITAKNVKKGFIQKEPEEFISPDDFDSWMTRGIPQKGDVLITTEAPLGNVAQINTSEKIALAQRLITLIPNRKILSDSFLKEILLTDTLQSSLIDNQSGSTVYGIKASILKQIQIPLPPLSVQEEIVAEIEDYQKIIDGAKMVVENYKPKIDIAPEWEIKEFADAPFEIIDGDRGVNYPKKDDFSDEGYCLFLNTKNVRADGFNFNELMFITKEKDEALRKGKLQREDVLLTTRVQLVIPHTMGNMCHLTILESIQAC